MLELDPASRFRTGAMFPGRYCIPFSFDDDQRERQRYDQLAVIARILGEPTAAEMDWASPAAQAEMLKVCHGGKLSTLQPVERAAQLDSMLSEACPVTGGEERALMRALLEFSPAARPSAEQALQFPYFAPLADGVQTPVLTPPPDAAQVEAAFAFEDEKLGANELRILLANDLFRYNLDGAAAAGGGGGGGSAAAIS